MYHLKKSTLAQFALAGAVSLMSTSAYAAAFGLHEQNASGLGEFYAGASAVAEDPSTNWYNSAGLVLLDGTQIAVSGIGVFSDVNLDGTANYATAYGYSYQAEGNAQGGTNSFVPALHISHKINDQWAVGFSAVSPFGLSTSYDSDSVVRYQGVDSKLITLDLSPSVAYKINDMFSLGAGFDAQYSKVELTGMVHLLPAQFDGTDVLSQNEGDSWGWGWHAGALAMFGPQTRIGLNFHSQIQQDYEGTSQYAAYENDNLTGTLDLPWDLNLSGYHAFNQQWAILGTVAYTHWSSVQDLVLDNVNIAGVQSTSSEALDYEDSWTFLAGLRYQINEVVMVKFGGGYDQTPTTDAERDVRLPDSDRWIASAGIRLVPPTAKYATIDFGYAHLFFVDTTVNKNLASPPAFPVNEFDGDVTGHADLIGAQLTIRM